MKCQNCGFPSDEINKVNAVFGMRCSHCDAKLIAEDLEK